MTSETLPPTHIAAGACRPRPARRGRAAAFASCAALCASLSAPSHAQLIAKGDTMMLGYAPHVIHFHPSPEHVSWNNFVALELHTDRTKGFENSRAIFGLALFDNSFGQFSQYLYWGQIWRLYAQDKASVFGKVTFGLLNGYKPPYDEKLPFNSAGVAPVIIPSIGYRYGSVAGEMALLGANGLLLAVSYHFDPF